MNKTIQLSEVFTEEQGKDLVTLYVMNMGAHPAKAFLKYIQTKPDVLAKCDTKQVDPAYLSYYLEYAFNASSMGFRSAE